MKYIDENEAESLYRDLLDELYPVEIAGMAFCASRILEELDPTAFNCGLADWLDGEGLTTDLISYQVELLEADAELDEDGDKASTYFDCEAEDEEHAQEQAINAYPACEVIEIEEV
jgi:hypothetical protein